MLKQKYGINLYGRTAAMYAALSQEQKEKYLSRIGYTGPCIPTYDVLAQLMDRHCSSIPFENLDVYYFHNEPGLTLDELFSKLILHRRGGYCFELNGLFSKLLKALGYDVSACVARIVTGDAFPTPCHETLIVTIDEKRYFCDVGFGGPVPRIPLEIRYDEDLFCISGKKYRFEKQGQFTSLHVLEESGFRKMMLFDETPVDPVDFLPLNAFCAYSPKQPFIHKAMVWIKTPDGRTSLDGNVLRISNAQGTTERILSTFEETSSALIEHFGLDVNRD